MVDRASPIHYSPWPNEEEAGGVIFVMGCGRSGTHWLGHILNSHPDIRATIEQPEIFGCVTQMAMRPPQRWALMPGLVKTYRRECARTSERYYADKSHPSMWIAEYLADAIPTARFIGIERDPYQTVASMLTHRYVSDWPRRWREFPVPNRFLGIDSENAATYETLTPAQQHSLRWLSHHQRLDELQGVLGNRLHLVQYSDLQDHTERSLARLQAFLRLETGFPAPEIRKESVGKWRTVLSDDDVSSIRLITGVDIPPADC